MFCKENMNTFQVRIKHPRHQPFLQSLIRYTLIIFIHLSNHLFHFHTIYYHLSYHFSIHNKIWDNLTSHKLHEFRFFHNPTCFIFIYPLLSFIVVVFSSEFIYRFYPFCFISKYSTWVQFFSTILLLFYFILFCLLLLFYIVVFSYELYYMFCFISF